ncbi:hypothetical protein BBJ28_00003689 [Nothophytophthora sp. Chile5]|nr:hypothetical protein BBJ28_00003689 [Nothophytophthora sp. Chile5]
MRRPLSTPRFFIDPEARGKRAWDLLLTSLVLYTTCVVPYRVCFQVEATGGFAYLETAMDVAFSMDIGLNFITGLQLSTDEVCYDFRVIVRAYLRGWFTVDFFSTLPFDSLAKVVGVGDNAPAALLSTKLLRGLKVLRLFKLARIRRLGKVFTNLEDAVYTNQSLVSLAKLALTMLFIAHIVACIWYAVGKTNSSESWLVEIAHSPAGQSADTDSLQYVRSVYWAIVTMSTIGYGDIVAHNNNERLLNIGVMAVGVSFFGYVIGTISTLVTNLDVAAARYDERMTIVKEYIISRQMPKHVGNKIRHHFEYFYQNRSVFKERRILQRLPLALRNEMVRFTALVASIKYFENCHESLISDIVMAMRPFSVLKDEYVYVQHEIAAHVFFLLKGKIQIVKTLRRVKEDLRLASMGIGDHFGEVQADTLAFTGWPEVIKHFREAAAASSKSMQRRVNPSARDPIDHSITPNREVLEPLAMAPTVLKSSTLNSKVVPSRPGRVSPFLPSTEINTGPDQSPPPPIPEESEEPGDDQQSNTARSVASPRSFSSLTTEFSPSHADPDRGNHAWVALSDATEPSALRVVHPLAPTRPFLPMALGRRATLEALPASPTAKTKPEAQVAAFDSLDVVNATATEAGELEQARKYEKEVKMTIQTDHEDENQDHQAQTQASSSQHRYTPSPVAPAIPETLPTLVAPSSARSLQYYEETLDHQELMDQLTDQALPGAPVGGRTSLAGAADENELHDMIAKIRDSAHDQPKRNFNSERVMLRGTYLFHPQEPTIVTWQFFVGIGIIYSIIVVPFRLGFDFDAVGGWYVLEFTIDSFFFLDILLNFRTAYFDDERRLIYDPRVLFWRYAKGWFLLDFISTVPIDELFQLRVCSLFLPLLRLFRIARLLKLTRLIKLSRVFGRIRDTVQLSPSTERLLKLLAIMSVFCHWNACLFHAVMLASESAGYRSWCGDAFFPEDPALIECSPLVPLGNRYIAAVYWAFTTLTTVGYGDVKPSLQSNYELLMVIVLIVVNATVFGYILSSVITLIRNLDPSDREYRLLMTEMKDYLRDATVSARLCTNAKMVRALTRTSPYRLHQPLPRAKGTPFSFTLRLNTRISTSGLHVQLFDMMSPSLRFDVARLVAGETLFAIPLITVMEDSFKGFVSYALFLMKPVCIQRGEKVCRCGAPGTEMFFLVEGECDLMNSQTGLGRIIGENAVFEQYALMTQPGEIYRTVSTATALSAKCILYSLTIQNFKYVALTLEDVSPAVSTYFLSQLASVLVADGVFTLLPQQMTNVHRALRRGQNFRAVAEYNSGRAKLKDLGKVAMANLYKRRGSEWSPDLLPKQLQLLAEKDQAYGATTAGANVNAIANQANASPHGSVNSTLGPKLGLPSIELGSRGGAAIANIVSHWGNSNETADVAESGEQGSSRRAHMRL